MRTYSCYLIDEDLILKWKSL